MKAMLLQARVDLRGRWRSWTILAVLVAITGGSVLALAAGARRTDSAYPRFLSAERAADIDLFLGPSAGDLVAAVNGLPEVAESSVSTLLVPADSSFVLIVLPAGGGCPKLDCPKLVSGRMPHPDRPDEVAVGYALARDRHLHVGSRLTVSEPAGPPTDASPDSPPAPDTSSAGAPAQLRIVGIEATPLEFNQSSTATPSALVAPAFLHTPLGARLAGGAGSGLLVSVRLHRRARDVAAFTADLQRVGGQLFGSSALADRSVSVQRSFHLQTVALWLMAGFAGVAGALVLVQLLARQAAGDAGAQATLRALGTTSGQLLGSGVIPVAAMAVVGAAGAVVVAVMSSPLFPLGTPRSAEPHPGFAVDVTAMALGAGGVLVLMCALGTITRYRAIRTSSADAERAGPVRSSATADALAAVGAPLVMTTGVRLALQRGRGSTAVPVRPALAATAIGVAAMATAITFGASLGHLLATPALYGVTFDAHVEGTGFFSDITPAVSIVRADPAVAAVGMGSTGLPLQAGRVKFDGWSVTSVQGSLLPTIIDGRLPAGPTEIVLGSRTLQDLHAHLGGTINVAVRDITRPQPMRIVGRGVLASVSDLEQLGRGAVLAPDVLTALTPLAPPGFEPPPPGDAFVRFRPGVSVPDAIADLQNRLGATSPFRVTPHTEPADVANFGQVRNLPQILAGLLGVVAAAALAYLLVTAIRRRRRDLAVLKTLGFVPRQISAVIAWQATTVVLVAAVPALPLGVAAGRWTWATVAGQAGLVVQPAFPWWLLLGLVPAAVLIANVVAAAPAVVAGRISPAPVLRTE